MENEEKFNVMYMAFCRSSALNEERASHICI